MQSTRPKAFLLDADVVIHLHTMGLWTPLCTQADVCVPSVVARIEVLHYVEPETELCIGIDLLADIGAQRVTEYSASADDMRLLDPLGRMVLEGLHEGEREALALMCSGRLPPGSRLCSADQAAVRAAVLLSHDGHCSSLEGVLQSAGIRPRVPIGEQFTDRRFQTYVRLAAAERTQLVLNGLHSPGARRRGSRT